jgi:LemA protein
MPIFLIAVAVVIALAVLWLVVAYNRFIKGRNLMREAWSGIEVQLKRRYDLIPNLIETVKGYMGHERSLIEKVTDLRSRAMTADTVREKGQAENVLTQSLRSLFAVAEAYPDLKANQNFLELQRALSDIEEQVQLARRYYNGTVRDFNILVESFPTNVLAGMFGFKVGDFFEISDEAQRSVPEVKF